MDGLNHGNKNTVLKEVFIISFGIGSILGTLLVSIGKTSPCTQGEERPRGKGGRTCDWVRCGGGGVQALNHCQRQEKEVWFFVTNSYSITVIMFPYISYREQASTATRGGQADAEQKTQ
jgi:hypothetical protein